MERLLASSPKKITRLNRGEKVEGEIVAKGKKELILDIGSKAEGVLQIRDLPKDQQEALKPGDKFEAFVVLPENESGQVTLALHQASGPSQKYKGANWAKFQNALNKKSKLQGKVLEINKGGLIMEVEGIRGFLPNSQVGFEALVSVKQGLETLVDQTMNVTVAEVDTQNNRLIFSQRGQVSPDLIEKIKKFKQNTKVRGKIVAILPFGLVIDLDGTEGLVFISDVSWEKVEDLGSIYQVGQEIDSQVLSLDEDFGRVNLSIKHLSEDPFIKISAKYPADEMIKGEITEITNTGIVVKLDPSTGSTTSTMLSTSPLTTGSLGTGGVEGFLPASKIGDTRYEVGSSMSFLVDGVDKNKRRINLAPFITTTAGLIYK